MSGTGVSMSLLTNFARGVKVELIAKLATSYEAYDGGTLIKGVARHNIRDYFRKYGSTARKFDHIAEDDIYIGYVRMSYKPEFLSAIILAGENAVAVSFDSEVGESNDFLTLMAKKEFADRMTAAVQRAASFMRKAAPEPAPAPKPQAKAIAAPPTDPAQKGNDGLGWKLLLTVGAVMGIVILVSILTERQQAAAPPTGNFALPESYGTDAGNIAPSGSVPLTESAATPSPDDTHGYLGDTALTYGMMDSIMGGIDEFVAVYRRGGMSEAVSHSRQCFSQAESSTQISDLDKCAAFDFTAQFIDNAAVSQDGFPANQYFAETNARLDALYARFPEHDLERLALIKGQTAVVMRENGIGY